MVGEGHTQRPVNFMTKPQLVNPHHGQAIGNAVFEKCEPPWVSSPGPSPDRVSRSSFEVEVTIRGIYVSSFPNC